MGESFIPSGIHRLVTHGVPSALPIAAPMRRQAMPWSIQNARMAGSACDSVMLSAAFGCEKYVGIEVEADAERLGPIDPAGVVLGADLVAVDELPAELAVRGMQVEAMRPGQQRERKRRVRSQVVGGACLARIVSRRRQAAAEPGSELLEAFDVVALPAVQRDRNRGKARERRLAVDAGLAVSISGHSVGAVDSSGHHHYLSLSACPS